MKVIGKFNKDKRYSIVEIEGVLFALFNLKKDGTYDAKYESKNLQLAFTEL